MVMEPKMIFSTYDWHNKLSDAQRYKLNELKVKAKATKNNHNPVSSPYNSNSTQSNTSSPTTSNTSNPSISI